MERTHGLRDLFWGMWVVDDEAMGLFKRARACLEKSVDLGRKAQKAVPVAFGGAFS